MGQEVELQKEEAAEECGATDAQGKTPVASKSGQFSLLDWIALALAAAAVVCAFLPWLKVSTILAGGVGALSGLVDSWTSSSGTLPSFQDQYSILAFPSLADTIDGYVSLLKTVGATGYLDTNEAVGYLSIASIATYVVFAFWATGIVLAGIGTTLYVASRGRRKALCVVGIALIAGLALVWSCAYNVVSICVDGAKYVISGVSPWSIACFVLGLAAIVCIAIARAKGLEKPKEQEEDAAGDAVESMERIDGQEVKPSSGGVRKAIGKVACGVVIALLVVAVIAIAPRIYSDGTGTNSDAASSAKGNDSSPMQGGSKNDEASVAAVLGGNTLEEQAVTDYVEEFRDANGLTSDQDWIAWMQGQGYTPESVRNEVLDYLLTEWALEIACEENGIEITQDDIESYLAEVRNSFEGEDEYQTALSESGLTEEAYASEIILPELMRERLGQEVLSEDERENEEALETWLENYRSELGESLNPMPDGLSYDAG